MCGIAGVFFAGNSAQGDLGAIARRMVEPLTHRGPDVGDVWSDPDQGIALGHRRLSILDLSAEGMQPMHSRDGRYVVVFNGEIYNHTELRKELEGQGAAPAWRGHSDTETMLAAIVHWGLETAVSRFAGMFAFALWDRRERVLHLVRDRLGEKPFYYGWMKNAFVFGSELKALRAYPAWHGEINRDALAVYMRLSYIPAPHSIYRGVYKLVPGTMARVESRDVLATGGATRSGPLSARTYWSVTQVAMDGVANPFRGGEAEAAEQLECILKQSVKRQMAADVPLGAFLSGGVDSSTVVALMQAQADRPVKTFTIGFDEPQYDEAIYAKAVAKHLGTEHTEFYITPKEAMAVIPRLPTIYDEPFADSSQIPTFLVSQLARRHVTVSLSGDGGDELFAGYNHYFRGQRIWNAIGWMPHRLRSMTSVVLRLIPPQAWDGFFFALNPLLPPRIKLRHIGDKLHKLAEAVTARRPDDLYLNLISLWKKPDALVLSGREPAAALTDISQRPVLQDFVQRMMHMDTTTYLPDDILVKLDRASMAVGLEARVPLLDHRLVEFSWRLPLSMKIRNDQGKWLLRRVLYKYVPRELIERKKMGFSIPIDEWLRGPLRDWAEELLDERRLRQEGFFHHEPIREKWREHLSGHRNWQHCLWNILMFQAWLEHARTTTALALVAAREMR